MSASSERSAKNSAVLMAVIFSATTVAVDGGFQHHLVGRITKLGTPEKP